MLNGSDLKSLVSRLDRDWDGKVTYEEFKEIFYLTLDNDTSLTNHKKNNNRQTENDNYNNNISSNKFNKKSCLNSNQGFQQSCQGFNQSTKGLNQSTQRNKSVESGRDSNS